MSGYDVAVLGLGAMGSAAAHHLSARGASVLGLEQFTPGHDRGSSHGDSRIIRQAYLEDPSYVPLLRAAYDLWSQTEADSGEHLLTLTGGLMIGRPDTATVSGSRRSAQIWGLDHQMLDADQIRTRFPSFTPDPDEVALYEERAGYVEPEKTVRTQLRLAGEHGADLRFGQRVVSWSAGANGVEVRTVQDRFSADRLVVTAGAWAPQLIHLAVPLRVERQVMHWFAPDGGVGPLLAPGHPVYVWEDESGDQIYGFPVRPDEETAKVAFVRRPVPADPDRLDRTVHPEEVEEISAYLTTRLPALRVHERAAACMYTLTPDHHFVIGPHPDHDRVSLAAGFSGHGFKFAPLVGQILADLSLEGRTAHAIALFDPTRFDAAQRESVSRA